MDNKIAKWWQQNDGQQNNGKKNVLIKITLLSFSQRRSIRSQRFFKLGVVKIFAIFITKHLCRSLLLIKLQVFRPANLLKRDSNTSVIAQLLRTPFFTEHLRWFLLLAHNSVRCNIATAKSLHEFNTSEMQMRLFQKKNCEASKRIRNNYECFFYRHVQWWNQLLSAVRVMMLLSKRYQFSSNSSWKIWKK